MLRLVAARLPWPLIRQVGLYGIVSVLALAIDSATFLKLADLGLRPAIAASIGYSLGLIVHFVLSSRFVFNGAATGKSPLRLFLEFAMTGLGGLLITAVCVTLMIEGFGASPIAAKAVAVALSFAAVFVVRRAFVFLPSSSR